MSWWKYGCKSLAFHLHVCNGHIVCFNVEIQKHHFVFCIFFMETNPIIIVYNNFVSVKHGLHHLNYDLILNVGWCVF
jgi:hypothetical protein